VLADLFAIIDQRIKDAERTGAELPRGMSGKRYSGKFNLRVDKQLHERLEIGAFKQGKSRNAYCAGSLANEVSR